MGKEFKDDVDFAAISTGYIRNLCEAAGVRMVGASRATDTTPITIRFRTDKSSFDQPAWDALLTALPAGARISLETLEQGLAPVVTEVENHKNEHLENAHLEDETDEDTTER